MSYPLGVCQAPAGACGFRTRAYRAGQAVARVDADGTLRCACGSEMKPRVAADPKPANNARP